MNNTLNAFVISGIAGISTVLGTIIIFFKTKKSIITRALAFAAGVMFTVSIIDLLPSAFHIFSLHYITIFNLSLIFLFVMIGFLLSTYFGHELTKKVGDNNLLRIGLLSLIAIVLHNIPEGIATFLTSNSNFNLGITLAMAIGMHNIPEGISIALPIFMPLKVGERLLYILMIAGISEIFGSIMAFIFFKYINDIMMGMLYAIIAGIMINISLYELIPTSLKDNKKQTFIFLMMGIIVMLLVHSLLV